MFSEEDINCFNENGYVLLTDFFSEEGCIPNECLEEIIEYPESEVFHYFEDVDNERKLCRTENFYNVNEKAKKIVDEKLIPALQELTNEEFFLFKEKINYKRSGGGAFNPHQDAPAYVSFEQFYHLTVMIAVDSMTIENGCLYVVNNSNKLGTLPQEDDGSIKRDWCNEQEWKPIVCPAGSVLIFDSYVPHKSDINKSDNFRRAFFFTFNKKSDGDYHDDYYQKKLELFPPDYYRVENKDYSGPNIFNLATPIK
eukprot:TRINITY_DN1238_c2_g1_i1.p1 TRINITY_DN1238_c2_g1~~TRINITY_DN1238_c2_g1_i1.p1  ORF type:complete len:254 (+),score=73.51 TRINITY_DN1238_c2_g1_i1:82-843(+)